MNKKILIFIIIAILMPISVSAKYLVTNYSYGVTDREIELIQEEESAKTNIFEDLKYRFIEKEDKDMADYTILTVLIALIIMVLLFLNKKTYITLKDENIFEN